MQKKKEREVTSVWGDVRNWLGWEVILRVGLEGEWEFSG